MKVCLSSRNTVEYLLKADEIKVQYKDHEIIPNLIERYPKATIILDLNKQYEFNETDETSWADIIMYNDLAKNNFICCTETLFQMNYCKENNLKFYYGFPINSFYELQSLKKLGVCYLRLAPPLTHMLPDVAKLEIPIRAVPNICYQDYLPHQNGIHGQWIRPEDLHIYELYIDTIEFEDCNEIKEQALYRIYMEEHEWPGDFDMLFTNFNHPGVNRMIEPIVGRTRMSCGQRCEQNGSCHLCDISVQLADPEMWEEYQISLSDKGRETLHGEEQNEIIDF